MLAQSARHAHRRGGFDAGDGLPVELVAALDDDRAVLGDNRTVGDRSSQRGAEVGELTARGGREDDTVPSHADHDGLQAGRDASFAVEQSAVHVGDHES